MGIRANHARRRLACDPLGEEADDCVAIEAFVAHRRMLRRRPRINGTIDGAREARKIHGRRLDRLAHYYLTPEVELHRMAQASPARRSDRCYAKIARE
jgi:hypothetical protein